MDDATRKTLIEQYRLLAEHTAPECAGKNQGCKVPHMCCSPEYCELSQQIAQEMWGVDVSGLRTNHDRLPFMGEKGCVLEPHLRPICSRHACCINGLGAKIRGESAGQWTNRYYEILDVIEAIEAQQHQSGEHT